MSVSRPAIPRTMKALLYSSLGRDHFNWTDSSSVPGVRDGDILVKIAGASLNHMDYFAAQIPLFRIMRQNKPAGFDLSGTIVATGKSVKQFSVGDRVFGFGQGFAEYAKVKPWMVTHAPVKFADLPALAGYSSVGVTALQIVNSSWLNRAYAERVKEILVIGGSGGVGSSVIQLCKLLGPPGVSVTSVASGKNEALCKSLGATGFINYNNLGGKELSSVVGRDSVDLIIDCVSGNIGAPNYVDDGMTLLNNKGVYVATNSLRPKDYFGKLMTAVIGSNPVNHRFTLFMVNPFRASQDLKEISHLIDSRGFSIPIDRVIPFTENAIRGGLAKLEQRHASGKTIIQISSS